jgi:hypothetical protein
MVFHFFRAQARSEAASSIFIFHASHCYTVFQRKEVGVEAEADKFFFPEPETHSNHATPQHWKKVLYV